MSINICATLGGNAGQGDCEVRMKRPKYILPTRGKVFAAADFADEATFKAALIAAMLLPRDDNNKVFCFPLMRVVDDNTADANTQSLADGYEEVLNESLPNYTLQSTSGTCQAQAMVKFNGWQDEVFVIDAAGVFWYVVSLSGGGQGFSVGNLYTNPPRFGNSANIVTQKTKLLFGTIEEFKGGLGAIKVSFDPTKLANTVDVVLYEKLVASANVLKIAGKAFCADTDIYAGYSTALANVARWSAINATTGAAITITSVAVDATNKAWTFTLDSTAHSALPSGGKVIINLVSPAVLAAAGVTGIEGLSFVYTKP
jgi:hypothetical protein